MLNNYAIIGYPLENNLFSLIHSSFVADMGINAGCSSFELKEADELPILMHFLERFGFKGLSIAAPHKHAVTQFMAEVDDSAKRAGLANMLMLGREGWVGYNTEIYGFARLMELEDIEPNGKAVVIFGTGAGAAAVLCALEDRGVHSVRIISRKQGNVSRLQEQFAKMTLAYHHYDDLANCAPADVVINTIPIDWGNKIWQDRFLPNPNAVFGGHIPKIAVDLQMSSRDTSFLSLWAGAQKVNGEHMFTEQLAKVFEIWHGARR
jgi:shikimate dehydrogenase